MSRGKSVTKLLLDSSQAALFAGVEIHNKPHIDYRYPTSVILIINAWELALKAYVYKYIGKNKIYERDEKHTITFSKAMTLVREDINNLEKNKKFNVIYDNLTLLNEYRCSNIHFIESELDAIIFMLLSKAVLSYDVFIKKFFKRDITRDDNLIILPVGFKLPFNPIDYLSQNYNTVHNDFINAVIHSVRELNSNGIQDSIIVGFTVVTNKVRDIKNADIIAALSDTPNATELRRSVRVTDDPSAPIFRIEPSILPLRYADLRTKVKSKDPSIKFGKAFNFAMKKIKANNSLCQVRYLDPKNKSGLKTEFYDENAVDALIREYHEILLV